MASFVNLEGNLALGGAVAGLVFSSIAIKGSEMCISVTWLEIAVDDNDAKQLISDLRA